MYVCMYVCMYANEPKCLKLINNTIRHADVHDVVSRWCFLSFETLCEYLVSLG